MSKNRGRLETRTLTVCDVSHRDIWPVYSHDWPGLQQVLRLEREVRYGNTVTSSVSYAITSVPANQISADQLLRHWRNHWGIENCCFYVRDVTLKEDLSRLRTKNSPHNMATLRNAVLTLLHYLRATNIAKTLREHLFHPQKLLTHLGLHKPRPRFNNYPA